MSDYQKYSVTLSEGAKGESGEYDVVLSEMGLAGLVIGLIAFERGNLEDLSNLENVAVRTKSRRIVTLKNAIPNSIIISEGEDVYGSDEDSIVQNQEHKYAVRIEMSRDIVVQYPDKSFETGLEEAFRIEGEDPDEYLRYY